MFSNKLILILFIGICLNVNLSIEKGFSYYGLPSRICYLDFLEYFPQCYVSHALSYYNEEKIEICNYFIRCNGKIYKDSIAIKDIKDLVLD